MFDFKNTFVLFCQSSESYTYQRVSNLSYSIKDRILSKKIKAVIHIKLKLNMLSSSKGIRLNRIRLKVQ